MSTIRFTRIFWKATNLSKFKSNLKITVCVSVLFFSSLELATATYMSELIEKASTRIAFEQGISNQISKRNPEEYLKMGQTKAPATDS